MKLYDELVWRGLIQEISSEDLIEKLNNGGLTFYIGTDPTADSMHIGHYSSFLISKRLASAGHHPILLVGGATGLIGDPKPDSERPMITKEEVNKNFIGLKKQAEKIFGFEVVNNWDWTKDINIIDFLRDYGKYFNVNYMLDKDIIRRRLDSGITYTEFSYMILQALDFKHLHECNGVDLQCAGSDQWGNITAGIELLRREKEVQGFGLTMPLITKADGTKFGKTEGNAVWLDAEKTTPYEFYQFWINTDDRDVIKFLKYFTFLSLEEIAAVETEFLAAPESRLAQKKLAEEVTSLVHGQEAYEQALRISQALFSGDIKGLSGEEIKQGFKGVPTYNVTQEDDLALVELLITANVVPSKRQAREDIKNGAIYINGERIQELTYVISESDKIDGHSTVIRRGKKKYHLLQF